MRLKASRLSPRYRHLWTQTVCGRRELILKNSIYCESSGNVKATSPKLQRPSVSNAAIYTKKLRATAWMSKSREQGKDAFLSGEESGNFCSFYHCRRFWKAINPELQAVPRYKQGFAFGEDFSNCCLFPVTCCLFPTAYRLQIGEGETVSG